MIVKNSSLTIATKDNNEAMSKFYIEVLGFQKDDFGGHTLGNFSLFFDRHSKAAVKALEPFRVMITFSVDDIQDAYNELKGKGVEFVREPASEEWGGMFATFVDPDGNYLQLFQIPVGH